MKKIIFTIAAFGLMAVSACSSSDDDNSNVTTEPVVTRTITELASGPISPPTTTYFNLETGLEVPASEANTKNWDISFQRAEIRLNGGISGPGNAAAAIIENVDFDDIDTAPNSGYVKDGNGPVDGSGLGGTDGLAFNNWFNYVTEVEPENQVYIIRTAKNKYAKLQIYSYYSAATPPQGGRYTFKYTIQPGGSKVLQ